MISSEEGVIEIAQLYSNSLKRTHDQSLNFIEFYNKQYEKLKLEIKNHAENEPLKLFKSDYEIWKKEKQELNAKLEKVSKIIQEEYCFLEQILSIKGCK